MNRPRAGTIFLWLALTFGSIFALLIPPFQSPDEPGHFMRAYQISEGVFFPEKKEQRLGGTLPASLAQVRDSFSFLKMDYNARLDKDLIFRCLKRPLHAEQRVFADFPNTAVYAPTAYLPQAAAIALLRPLGTTPLQMLYAARLANLLAWALLVFSAIRLFPFLKNTMATLALLPASLVIAASANADVITNGLCWWLVAGFCAHIPSWKNWASLAVSFAIVCANKLIALSLVLVYWRGTSRRKHLFLFSILAIIGLTAALTWGSLAQKWFIPYDAYNPAFRDAQTLNEGVDPARQQAFMLENPVYFAKIALQSIAKALPSTAAHFVGKFGWEKNYLPPMWLGLLWLSLAALLMTEANPLTGRQRLLAAGVAALYFGMFSVTMYALWCPVGAAEVTNFQGRYFVPIAPVLALALAGTWLRRLEKQVWWVVFFVLIMSNLAMTMNIWGRYYG